MLEKYKRCFSCLNRGHLSRNYRFKDKTYTVIKGHLHRENTKWRYWRKYCIEIISKSPASVAYQTLQVMVKSSDGGKKIKCRVLLDSVGGRTFFSQKLADQLKGKTI